MIFQLGARIEFRNTSTQALIGERQGFTVDLDSADLMVGAPWTSHAHYWTPKEGFQAILEVGVRRRAQDPAHTGQIGGRVRVIRLSDGVEVENESFAALIDATTLDTNGQWVKHEKLWDATANVQGRLQVGVKLPSEAAG
jgi:hypothetical protein